MGVPLKYLSAGFGALIWLLGCLASGRAEAWDSGLYWSVFFPLMLAGAVVAGARAAAEDGEAWRQGLWMGAGHAAMVGITGLFTGAGFGLFPLTIIVFVLMTMPLLGAAAIGGRIGRKLTAR